MFTDENMTDNAETGYSYAAEYIPYDYITGGALGSYAGAGINGYNDYASGEYTALPAGYDASYLTELARDAAGIADGDGLYVKIAKVAEYISSVAPYNENYDEYTDDAGKTLDEQSDIVRAFLTDDGFRESGGVCRHFASAAVLMYRALGIPARYTIGYVADTEADVTKNVTGADAHSWAEVYIAGSGWVQVEVTGGFGGGTPSEEKTPLTVYTSSDSKTYDGTPLVCYEIDSAVGLLGGHEVVVNEDGDNASQTEVGSTDNYLDISVIVSETGADVTYLYSIEQIYGTLAVTGIPLSVQTGSIEEKWTGDPIYCHKFDITEGELLPGHKIEVDENSPFNSYITDVGSAENNLVFKVTDANDADVTKKYYDIEVIPGTLTVTPIAEITVTTPDETWDFDGTAHSTDEAFSTEITAGAEELVGAEVTAVPGSGASITFPTDGGVENGITVRVTRGGEDITGGVKINYEFGTLNVDPVEINVTTGGGTFTYNGTPHSVPLTDDEVADIQGQLISGHTLEVGVFERINYGAYDNTIPLRVFGADGEEMTRGYKFVYDAGVIDISRAEITITTHGSSKPYDGKPLVCKEYDVTGLAEGHRIVGTDFITGSQTTPGSSQNGVNLFAIRIVDENGEDVIQNYTIKVIYGTLTVT